MYSNFGNLASDIIVQSRIDKEEKEFLVANNTFYVKENKTDDDVPIPVVFYGGVAKYLQKASPKKGDELYIEGYFKHNSWIDKQQQKRSQLVLVANTVRLPKKLGGASVTNDVEDVLPLHLQDGYDDNEPLPLG